MKSATMPYVLLYEYRCYCGMAWSATEQLPKVSDPQVLAQLARPAECPACGRSVVAYPLLRPSPAN